MVKRSEAPKRSHEGVEYDETHPAYASISASRVSGGGKVLFGSDFRHQNYVAIRVHPAKLRRSLSSDWHFSDVRGQIIELVMSDAQWASFVASPNQGSGVPCTLNYVRDIGFLPDIEAVTDRREQFRREVDDRLGFGIQRLREAIAAVGASKAGVREKEAITNLLESAAAQLTTNLDYVADQFDEHAEHTVQRARIEVDAYVTSLVARAGLTALGDSIEPPFQLTEGDTE